MQIPNVIVESESPTKEQEANSLANDDANQGMEGVSNHDTSAPMESVPAVSQPPTTDANYMPGESDTNCEPDKAWQVAHSKTFIQDDWVGSDLEWKHKSPPSSSGL